MCYTCKCIYIYMNTHTTYINTLHTQMHTQRQTLPLSTTTTTTTTTRAGMYCVSFLAFFYLIPINCVCCENQQIKKKKITIITTTTTLPQRDHDHPCVESLCSEYYNEICFDLYNTVSHS